MYIVALRKILKKGHFIIIIIQIIHQLINKCKKYGLQKKSIIKTLKCKYLHNYKLIEY